MSNRRIEDLKLKIEIFIFILVKIFHHNIVFIKFSSFGNFYLYKLNFHSSYYIFKSDHYFIIINS